MAGESQLLAVSFLLFAGERESRRRSRFAVRSVSERGLDCKRKTASLTAKRTAEEWDSSSLPARPT